MDSGHTVILHHSFLPSGGHFAGNRSALTLVEVLLSLVIAGLLLIPVWTWQTSQARLQRHVQAMAAAQREISAAQQVLLQDFATAFPPGPLGARFRIDSPHRLTLTTASVIPNCPRGFRTVVWQWSEAAGLVRIDREVSHWLTSRVQLSFRQSQDTENLHWESLWTALDDQGIAQSKPIVLSLSP